MKLGELVMILNTSQYILTHITSSVHDIIPERGEELVQDTNLNRISWHLRITRHALDVSITEHVVQEASCPAKQSEWSFVCVCLCVVCVCGSSKPDFIVSLASYCDNLWHVCPSIKQSARLGSWKIAPEQLICKTSCQSCQLPPSSVTHDRRIGVSCSFMEFLIVSIFYPASLELGESTLIRSRSRSSRFHSFSILVQQLRSTYQEPVLAAKGYLYNVLAASQRMYASMSVKAARHWACCFHSFCPTPFLFANKIWTVHRLSSVFHLVYCWVYWAKFGHTIPLCPTSILRDHLQWLAAPALQLCTLKSLSKSYQIDPI